MQEEIGSALMVPPDRGKKPPSPTPSSSSSDDAVSSNVPLFGVGPPSTSKTPASLSPPPPADSPSSHEEPGILVKGPENHDEGGSTQEDDDCDIATSSHPPLHSPELSAASLRPPVIDPPSGLGLLPLSLAPLPFGKLGTVKSLVLPPAGPHFELASEGEVVQLMLNDSNLRSLEGLDLERYREHDRPTAWPASHGTLTSTPLCPSPLRSISLSPSPGSLLSTYSISRSTPSRLFLLS